MNSILSNVNRKTTNYGILTDAAAVPATRRINIRVQNLGTSPLFVKLGADASVTDFTVVLPGATGADNGTSLPREFPGYQGTLSTAGTTPRYTISEDIA